MTITNSCATCRATWTGLAAAHCAGKDRDGNACHRTFSSVSLFDAHRDGRTHRCHDPATVTDTQGVPRMVWRNGMWRGPEATPDQLQQIKTRRRR